MANRAIAPLNCTRKQAILIRNVDTDRISSHLYLLQPNSKMENIVIKKRKKEKFMQKIILSHNKNAYGWLRHKLQLILCSNAVRSMRASWHTTITPASHLLWLRVRWGLCPKPQNQQPGLYPLLGLPFIAGGVTPCTATLGCTVNIKLQNVHILRCNNPFLQCL